MIKNTTKNVLIPKEVITHTDVICDNCRKVLADKEMYFNMKIGLKTIGSDSSADAWDKDMGTSSDTTTSGSTSGSGTGDSGTADPTVVISGNAETYQTATDSPLYDVIHSSIADILANIMTVTALYDQITISKASGLSAYMAGYKELVKLQEYAVTCGSDTQNRDFAALDGHIGNMNAQYITFLNKMASIDTNSDGDAIISKIYDYHRGGTACSTPYETLAGKARPRAYDARTVNVTIRLSKIQYIRSAIMNLCSGYNELISAWSTVKYANINTSLTELKLATETLTNDIYQVILSIRSTLENIYNDTIGTTYSRVTSNISDLATLVTKVETYKSGYGSSFGTEAINTMVTHINTASTYANQALTNLNVAPTKDIMVSALESLTAENIDNDNVYEYQCCSNECVNTIVDYRNDVLKNSTEYSNRRLTVSIKKEYVTVASDGTTSGLGSDATGLDYYRYYNVGDIITFNNTILGDVDFIVVGKGHDKPNTLTLMTKDIVRIVPFDAREPQRYIMGDGVVTREGFNNYTCSNIRHWLLSDASVNWYSSYNDTFFVNPTDKAPSDSYVRNIAVSVKDSNNATEDTVGLDIESSTPETTKTVTLAVNPYDHLGGIMYGFGSAFRSLLVEHGRSTHVTWDIRSGTTGSNRWTLYDKLFLFSAEELGLGIDATTDTSVKPYEYFYENGIISKDKVIAYPNKYAVAANNLPSSEIASGAISEDCPWPYWLRNPRYNSYSEVKVVGVTGELCTVPAFYGYYGLRFGCVIG